MSSPNHALSAASRRPMYSMRPSCWVIGRAWPGTRTLPRRFRHRRLAPWLGHRPGELSCADDDSRLAEQDPVERVIVMRMREDDLGHVGGFQAALRELLDEALSHIEAADVHQRDVPVPADESNSAPAQAPVADHPSGEALDQDVDLVSVDLHRILHSARMLATRVSLPQYSVA